MTTPYEGPSRHEILLQILKYNHSHHPVDRILVSNTTQADLPAIKKVESNNCTTSDSAGHIDSLIKELEDLKRSQLRNAKGQAFRSSSRDWAQFIATVKNIVKQAEREKVRCDAKSATQRKTQALGRVQVSPVKPVPQPAQQQMLQDIHKTGPKEKERHRKVIVQQKEITAHLSAKKLEGEVKGFEKET